MNSELLNLIENAPKVTLGNYIVRVERTNSAVAYGAEDVRGVSNTKGFMETRANIEGRSLKKFLVIEPFEFVFNRRTTRNGERLGLGFNMTDRAFILTEDYVAFHVKPEKDKELSPYFLYLYFLRDEFDRYVRSNSWGSATEFFNWDDMCRVKIPLPPIEVQRAYVDAYKGLTALIEENEALLKSLEATAQACVTECREKWPMVALSNYIKELNDRNSAEELDANAVRGISTNKEFIDTKADLNGVKLSVYKIVKPKSFAFVADTSRRGDKISLAFNCSDKKYLVSQISTVYEVSDQDVLLPEYLYLQFKRPEFDRYARFNSWGSARETFNWDDMCRVKIPLPPIEVQRAIVALYRCAEEARKIAEEAKVQLARVCPAMIQQASRRC
ncbi:restriction endonuclease subunit S [Sutterella wadsworthensis]|uniref:restriction endonuclease subunit S n=1 Tax=Sutterella wadsworthensis TaxID=40545 RepID=UPI00402ABD33